MKSPLFCMLSLIIWLCYYNAVNAQGASAPAGVCLPHLSATTNFSLSNVQEPLVFVTVTQRRAIAGGAGEEGPVWHIQVNDMEGIIAGENSIETLQSSLREARGRVPLELSAQTRFILALDSLTPMHLVYHLRDQLVKTNNIVVVYLLQSGEGLLTKLPMNYNFDSFGWCSYPARLVVKEWQDEAYRKKLGLPIQVAEADRYYKIIDPKGSDADVVNTLDGNLGFDDSGDGGEEEMAGPDCVKISELSIHEIRLLKDGQIELDNKIVTQEGLVSWLKDLMSNKMIAKSSLLFHAMPAVSYGNYLQVYAAMWTAFEGQWEKAAQTIFGKAYKTLTFSEVQQIRSEYPFTIIH